MWLDISIDDADLICLHVLPGWKVGFMNSVLHQKTSHLIPLAASTHNANFVSFHSDSTPELENTQPIQMVDMMSAEAQARPVAWASAAVMLRIVKDVLFLSVLFLELENTLPTRMVNPMSTDALATQLSGHWWPLCWWLSNLSYPLMSYHPRWRTHSQLKWSISCLLMIVKVVLFLSIFIPELENT